MPTTDFNTNNHFGALKSTSIGTFRCSSNLKRCLPTNLYAALFEEISDNLNLHQLITVKSNDTYLNHAAFGRAYDDVYKLSVQLQEFAEHHPDVFYDQVCLPLVKHTYDIVEDFFDTKNVLLVPNCTFGMKSITECLIIERKHSSVAYLNPLYGATKKLLTYYEDSGHVTNLLEISPGEKPLFEENDDIIISALEDAYSCCQYTVLFCDETASQSGRILPLKAVSKFCKANDILLVVDGTQSCELLLEKNIDTLRDVDFFVMSTHKWLGNIKTCGIIRYHSIAPLPLVISFGWEPTPVDCLSGKKIQSQFIWQGMLNSYISYITLGKAVKFFQRYGKRQFMYSSKLMHRSLAGNLTPLLSTTKNRVINLIPLENSQLELMQNISDIQNALQDYGIYASVKEVTQDCGTNKSTNKFCTRQSNRFYMRLSCWSYNKYENFDTLQLTFHNNLQLSTCSSAAVRHQFLFLFDLYEKLFSVLKLQAYFIRAEKLRHHLIFYYGHTSVFYINKLLVSGNIARQDRIDSQLESSLSVGVDEMSWDDILEDNYEWSGLDESGQMLYLQKIQYHRNKTMELVLKLINENPVQNPIEPGSLYWVLMMGIEHEKIHLETSAVIISQVPMNLIKKQHNFDYPAFWNGKPTIRDESIMESTKKNLANRLVPIPGGTVTLGKTNLEQDLYGWDNEFGHEEKVLEPFQASQMLVSNGEYLEFVNAGGYQEKKWWSQEGWKFVTDMNITEPRFWIEKKRYRALVEEIPIPWNLPVEVNNLEAQAFCKWKSEKLGKNVRLISHEESFHMRQIANNETSNTNLNKYASPTPVNLFGGDINGYKVYDISGNVWRHSVSILTVLNGFRIDPFYNDFTLPTIDGYHNHILGGSWISLGNCANLNARYGFRRHFYQYAGIRYVCSENTFHERVLNMFDQLGLTMKITEHYSNFTDEVLVEKKPIVNWPKLFGENAAQWINELKMNGVDKQTKVLIAYGGEDFYKLEKSSLDCYILTDFNPRWLSSLEGLKGVLKQIMKSHQIREKNNHVGRPTLEILRNCQNLSIDHTDNSANDLQVLKHLLEDSRIQWYQQLEGTIVKPMEYHLTESADSLLKDKNNSVSYWQADYDNMRAQLGHYDVIVADFRHKDGGPELLHLIKRLKRGGVLVLGSIDDLKNESSFTGDHSMTVLKSYCAPFKKEFNITEYAHMYQETKNKHQYFISQLSVWIKKLEEVEEVSFCNNPKLDSNNEDITTEQYYEDKDILSSYHRFHFGPGLLSVENFPLQMSKVCIEACQNHNVDFNLALEAGCGPGRTAIELCQHFKQVEAYDYSQSFVDMMQKNKEVRNISNLNAFQGDSHKQDELCGDKKFDLIFGCNLIDRLHTPKEWVLKSKAMLSPRGLLIISSPYTWKTEHTPIENSIGGFKKDGEDYYTVDGLRDLLLPELVLLDERKVPFVIPDADGTFQYTYSNCTIFGTRQ